MRFFKYILILIICLGIEQIALSQYYLKTKSDSTVLEGDSVLLSVDGYRGTVIWQASTDLINWLPIDEIKDTLDIRIDSTAYYRAVITDGTCEPVMSDTVKVIEKVIETNSNQFIVDTEGGIFLLPSGIKVKIPEGAVIGPKEIRLDILNIEDVNTLATVSNSDNVTFVTGISIATDLFDFKEPIKVKIPIQNIDENGYPFLYELKNQSNTWLFSDETKIVNQKDKYIEIILKESDQTTNTLQTKSKFDLNDVRSFFLELYGDIFLAEDPCRKIVAKIETTHLDNFSEGECNVILADEQFNYFACDPPQSDEYVALSISESCEPELKISPKGDLLLKKDETASITLSALIGKYPLSDQEIKIRTSGNLLVTTPLIFTGGDGNAFFDVKAIEDEGKGKIYLSVSFKYYLTTIKVNVGGNIEYNEEDLREVKLDTIINVIIYNDCTHPDELDCSSIANPNCPAIKETLIDEIVLINASSEIEVDESFLMELEAYNYLGEKLPAGSNAIWSSSDENIVVVNNGLITGVEVGVAIITAQVCDLIIQYKVEVVNTYELTWKFNAYWLLEEAVAGCSSHDMSGDGLWEGSATIEEHALGAEIYYEITSLSCDGLIQGHNNSCHGWINYTNSFKLEMEKLESRILDSFKLYTKDGIKYMVDPFKKSGSAYPVNFLGLHEGSFYFYDEYSTGQGDYSFEDAWGTLISPTTTYYTDTGYPFQVPQNYVTVFSNEDNDIPADDSEGNSYTKILQHLNAGVFENIPGVRIDVPSGIDVTVYCDVEIKLIRISTQ